LQDPSLKTSFQKKIDNKLQPQINCDKSPLELRITRNGPKKQDYKEKKRPNNPKKQDKEKKMTAQCCM
jgi:hypothetical protein